MASSLSIGAGALSTNLTALQVVGHNIANANTQGYSRQTVQTQSAGYYELGGSYFGNGVVLSDVSRMHSEYLSRESRLAASASASDSERYARLQQLENTFPIGEEGLGAAMNTMLNVWNDVVSSPSDLSARVVVLARGDDLASRIRETAGQLDVLSQSNQKQLDGSVLAINRLASDISKLNAKIVQSQGGSGPPNELLDSRGKLMSELSQYVNYATVAADDGSVGIFVAGSQPLVLGSTANQLEVTKNADDPSQKQIQFVQAGVSRPIADSALGGSLGGVMTFLNQDLSTLQNMLGRMALGLESSMNAQHQLGVDLAGNAGGLFFAASEQAVAVGAVGNAGNAEIRSQVVDPTALKASDYQITFGAVGVNVVRLSDGVSTAFASLPAEMDGLSFQLDSGAGAVNDSYRIRPFAQAARTMQMAISSPAQLAVASPVMATPAATNSEGLSIESIYATSPSSNLIDPVSISFLADGTFTASGLGPGNPPPDNAGPPPSYNYSPGMPLQFNGWSLTLRGNANAGDNFVITPAPAGSNVQNAGNGKAVLALRDRATFDGVTLSDGYSVLLSKLGTEVQGAKFAASFTDQMASATQNAEASFSGVNLDEEAARLMQFQQAYQASAKFLQTAQSTFDTLMQAVGS